MKHLIILIIFTSALVNATYSQTNNASSNLPFKISELKKLDSLELNEKREGTYVTGIPDISSDPINGFGYGAEGSIIFNGKKNNPFFEYTPYLTKLDVALFNTSKQQREIILTLDKPYAFHTKWRLRGEIAYEINPNLLYFGVTDNTLNTLGDLSKKDHVPLPTYNGDNYSDYENTLTNKYVNYNEYTKEEYILNISGEYSLFDSKMRVLLGFEAAGLNITTENDSISRIKNDQKNNGLLGVGKSNIIFIQSGLVYDTRDFEPDPNRGIFAEITNEFSNQAIGSDYSMDKLFVHVKGYQRLLAKYFKKLIFASRLGIGYTYGNSPFFEYQDEWSSEGSIEGLGGPHTIRGYKQSRFLDRGMYFFNTELRVRFAQFNILRQNISLGAVPFFDMGSVFEKTNQIFRSNRIRYSEGLGLRIGWNLSTILRFDYAVSQEDHQFFFTFDHAF